LDRNRNEVVAHYIGNGTIGAARELYEQVKQHNIRIAATDGNYCYDKIILNHVRHIADKAETCLVEAKYLA
jgi:IS1 family transposase